MRFIPIPTGSGTATRAVLGGTSQPAPPLDTGGSLPHHAAAGQAGSCYVTGTVPATVGLIIVWIPHHHRWGREWLPGWR